MRRHAWKQWRSCSADSDSMCPDSLASSVLIGWMRSPSPSSTLGPRVLGGPVGTEVGDELSQLARDGDVALRVPEPDRRTRRRARAGAGSSPPASRYSRRSPFESSTKSRISRFTFTGSRTCGQWPEPSSFTRCRRWPRPALRPRHRVERVLVAVENEHGAAHPGRNVPEALGAAELERLVGLMIDLFRPRSRGPRRRSPRSAWSNGAPLNIFPKKYLRNSS